MRIISDGLHLVHVNKQEDYFQILYDLLAERESHVNISHRYMPTPEEHRKFVIKNKYRSWYFIKQDDDVVGAATMTRQFEIGVQIFKAHQGKGYATFAVSEIMRMWRRDTDHYLANINPNNEASIALFAKFGFTHIQNTYRAPAPE